MKLLIDAGNTLIKWAVVDENSWMKNGVLPVEQAGEMPKLFAGFPGIRQIWVSNVAGEDIVRQVGAIKSGQPHFIVAGKMQCGVSNGYSNAGQLGSDRWAALIAAWHLVRGKCLVVNCGTATTIDVLSRQGEFLGGVILPGVKLMQRSLIAATDRLKPERGEYVPFPKNTADAMYSGAIQASCGAIMRQYALIGDGLTDDKGAQVILSGGAASVLKEHIKLPLRVVDELVLQGLLLISQEMGRGIGQEIGER